MNEAQRRSYEELPPELKRMSDLIRAKDREIRLDTLNEVEEWFSSNMPMVSKQLDNSASFQLLREKILNN